ncbi:MAG: dTDP-glucose 4,6-dehydratase [Acidimicrobiaceae bacterium]|nr:MAG: dTDP-glucose 4,6-dehydratase [Acidimicrobiaceae bacterium]
MDRSIADPSPFIETNCTGTANLCELVLKNEIEKYVHISTDEVYGSIGNKTGDGSFTEEDPLKPSSPYSATKAAADLIALSYHHTHGLPVSIIRPSNNYGPNQFPEKIIPLFITNLLEGKTVPLYGDGLNIRDWCNVADTCEAIDTVLRKGKKGFVYNAGAGNEKTNLELAERLIELCEADSSLIQKTTDRAGHDRRYSINSDLIHQLGWHPECDFEKGLEKTVNWYKENRKWWEPLRNESQ